MDVQNDQTKDGCSIKVRIEVLNRKLEALAANGRWSEFSKAMTLRDDLLARVAGADQGTVFKAAARANDNILKAVRSERQSVADQLTNLRRGRENSDRYETQRNV